MKKTAALPVKRQAFRYGIPSLFTFLLAACGGNADHGHEKISSYAIYAEYARDSNILMKPDLNRRIFDTAEAQSGTDISLETSGNLKGAITLEKGRYHITGFSMVTMQTTLAPPVAKDTNTYPGYAIIYPPQYQDSAMTPTLNHSYAIGSLGIPYFSTPSTFDFIFSCKEKTSICVGHQSGHDLHNEVYLSVYDVSGSKSNYHVFARVTIMKLE
jgi:hypothetical protein